MNITGQENNSKGIDLKWQENSKEDRRKIIKTMIWEWMKFSKYQKRRWNDKTEKNAKGFQ